jgi:NAD(P)-dependent dehydrogenase (short-subunit alcohol dehydrogenase family)
VLVTAGANGIGRAMALAFAANGAKVHACDIDAAALNDLRAQSANITTSVCDMGQRDDIRRMVDAATGALGGLDVLVNNAGIPGPSTPVAEMDPDAWEAVLRVNLTGTFMVTQLAIPFLKQSSAASIVVMSALAGRFGYPNRSPYSTTKWGLVGLTKTLSRELGEFGIRVNAILPGAVVGPRLKKVFEGRAALSGRTVAEEEAAELVNQSVKRFVDPADIAALAIFLASDAARSISGQLIPIDGDAQRAG